MNTEASQDLADLPCSSALKTIQHKSRTIVIIDDYDVILGVISSVLCQQGYTVVAFSHAHLALEYLRSDKEVDLIISDLIMPSIDGCGLALLSCGHTSRPPLLFITGHSAEKLQLHLKCGDKCAVSILRKPFGSTELLARVSEMLVGTPSSCPGTSRKAVVSARPGAKSSRVLGC